MNSPNPCSACNSGDNFDDVPNGSGPNVYAEGPGDHIIATMPAPMAPGKAATSSAIHVPVFSVQVQR